MKCSQAKQLMAMELAGDGPKTERRALAAHRATCRVCRNEWEGLWPLGARVQASASQPLQVRRDLVDAACGMWLAPPSRLRILRWASLPVVAAVAVIATVSLWPPSAGELLAAVEAASLAQPKHVIETYHDETNDRPAGRQEHWWAENGDMHSELTTNLGGVEGGLRNWYRAADHTQWSRQIGEEDYRLEWHGETITGHRGDFARQVRDAMPSVRVPEGAPDEVRHAAAVGHASGAEVDVREVKGVDEEGVGRVIEVVTRKSTLGDDAPDSETRLRYYLDETGTRVLRHVSWYEHPPSPRMRCEVVNDDSDTVPPAELFDPGITADTRVTYRGDAADPIWEYWTDAQKQELTEAFDGVAEAWCAGDWETFAPQYDFEAAGEYGLPRSPQPDDMRTRMRGLMADEAGRWQERRFELEYAFETCYPPLALLQEWLSPSEPGHSTAPLVVPFREAPSTEPLVVACANLRVTTHLGATLQAGTMILMKKLDGQYKAILWPASVPEVLTSQAAEGA